jgi:hypothetical protein
MTVYSSSDYSTNAPVAVHGERKGVQVARFAIATTALLSTADTFNFGYVPAGARLVGGYLAASDLDSGTTLTINVGDAGSGTRLFSASTVGQAGTTAALPVAALDYQYTAKTLITGAVAANAATVTSGTVTLVLLYYVEE